MPNPAAPPPGVPLGPNETGNLSRWETLVLWELKRIRRILELATGIDSENITLND